jgi:hypothetical protein
VALRLGRLQDTKSWRLKPPVLRSLLKKERAFDTLTDADFVYDVKQACAREGVAFDNDLFNSLNS